MALTDAFRSSRLFGLWCLVFAFANASAAELRLDGSRLLVMGPLDGSATAAFTEQLASGKVRTVVFEDAFGGNAGAAEAYAESIRANEVATEVRGQCHAACAYAFLAGKSHRFASGAQINGLLIPVAVRPRADELANRWRGENAHRTLAEFTGGRPVATASPGSGVTAPPATSPATALLPTADGQPEGWRPDHGVLFTSSPTLFGRVYNTYFCDGTQGRDFTKCERLSDADPYLLGVLTH